MKYAVRAIVLSACLGGPLNGCGSSDSSPSAVTYAADASIPGTTADASDPADATTGGGDAGSNDAGSNDVDLGPCRPDRAFRTTRQLSEPNAGTASEYNMKLSPDELTAYFANNHTGDDDIYTATRAVRTDPFGADTAVAPLNMAGTQEYWASVDGAGLLLVLERDARLYVSSRAHTSDPWSAPAVDPVLDVAGDAGSGVYVGQPHLMPDGATLYFAANPKGSWDIYRSTRSGGTWSTPSTVDELNTSGLEWAPAVTADGLTIYFGSDRAADGSPGSGAHTIWVAHRTSTASPFGAAHKVAELDLGREEWPAWISADNCRLYFTQDTTMSDGTNAYRTYVAEQ